MKVALISLQRGYETGRRDPFDEPVHLVGMHNRLIKKGIRSMIADPSSPKWKEQIRSFSPDIAGVTAPARELLGEHAGFVKELREGGVPIILGGVQATLDPAYYAEVYKPQALVLSQGEPVIDMFIREGFIFKKMTDHSFFKGNLGKTLVFRSEKLLSLDGIDHTRPYSLEDYGSAWPTSVFGCANQCVFCLPDKRIVFRSPDKFLEEMLYLAGNHRAKVFATMGPDFAARPSQADEIVRKLLGHDELMGKYYAITARIDSLAKAFRSAPTEWREFCSRNTVEFQPGIESFLPDRLMRFGKYRTLASAKRQREYLRNVLDFISDTKALLRGTLIMVDPESTVTELFADLEELAYFTEEFPGKFLIYEGDVFSFLRSAPGTKLDKMYDKFSDVVLMPKAEHPMNLALLIMLNYYMSQAKGKAAAEYFARMEGLNVQEQAMIHQDTTLSHIRTLGFAIKSLMDFIAGSPGKSLTHLELQGFLDDLIDLQFPGLK